MYGISFDQVFPGEPLSSHFAAPPDQLYGGGINPAARYAAMYYSNGFLSAGAGQTSSAGGGGGILSAITSGLETFLPAIFNRPAAAAAGTGQVIVSPRTPPIVPAGAQAGIPARVMGGITRTASQHPVLTAVGGAAATAGGALLASRMRRGTHRINADGTITRRHRRMNPCNIRALRRGLRRAHAFERIARKVLHFTAPHKSHGVAHFKRPKRRTR